MVNKIKQRKKDTETERSQVLSDDVTDDRTDDNEKDKTTDVSVCTTNKTEDKNHVEITKSLKKNRQNNGLENIKTKESV